MKTIISLLVNIIIIILPGLSLAESKTIASPVAVSQSGHFSINASSPLTLDEKNSVHLTNFIGYHNATNKKQLLIGAIPGDEELSFVCKNPTFLKNEKIANLTTVSNRDIHYFKSNRYNGCLFNVDKNKAAIIVAIPKPFVNQQGETIKLIGVVSSIKDLHKLQSQISFEVSAKDYFINLLQLSQDFSPFSKQINWAEIKKQGIEFIGDENQTCRGLSAAATFLVPALNKLDLHSGISTNGLNTSSCPAVPLSKDPLPEDKDMQKWRAIPATTRKQVINYISDFHGTALQQNIAYIYVPSISAFDPDTINHNITLGRTALANSNVDNACGIIVDLRFNTGGSLVPMLLTLSSIIPSGKLFNIGEKTPLYLSNDGNKLFNHSMNELYGQYDGTLPTIKMDKPVAILTNWMTSSSAAFTSLALRDNVLQSKVFGTKTSPTASINSTIFLLDGNTLNIMVDRAYNNKDEMVPLALPVNTEIEDDFETIFDLNKDVTLNAAKAWLKSLPTCKN